MPARTLRDHLHAHVECLANCPGKAILAWVREVVECTCSAFARLMDNDSEIAVVPRRRLDKRRELLLIEAEFDQDPLTEGFLERMEEQV